MGLLFLANIYYSCDSGWNQSAADFMKAASASIPALTDLTHYRSRGKHGESEIIEDLDTTHGWQ